MRMPKRSLAESLMFLAALVLVAGSSALLALDKPAGLQQQPPAPASPPSPAPAGEARSPQSLPADAKSDAPPITKEEEDAYLAFASLRTEQTQEIIVQGQAFLSKYAISPYRHLVYGKLEIAYLNTKQMDKLVSTGQRALNEDPDNLAVLAVMSATLPRIDPRGLDAAQRLDLAERYARHAIQLGTTLPKPPGLTDEQFVRARNEGLALAHSGLGRVYYHRGDTASSVSELDQATKLDPTPEPGDFYLLGDGEMKLKKYAEAAAAFDRCARAQWDSQGQELCRNGEAAAQKASAKQPPAPAKP